MNTVVCAGAVWSWANCEDKPPALANHSGSDAAIVFLTGKDALEFSHRWKPTRIVSLPVKMQYEDALGYARRLGMNLIVLDGAGRDANP